MPSNPWAMPSWSDSLAYIVNIDRKINMMTGDRRFLTARQAAGALGVTLPTLYAYASRGQIQSEPAPGATRERRYSREDIERLRERKELRRDPARAAERGLHWGSPVLPSGITLIQDGALYYRGHDALTLADAVTLESVAELLWDANAAERGRLFDQSCPIARRHVSRLQALARDPIATFQMALPLAALHDSAGHDVRPAAVRRTGARIMRLFTAIVTGHFEPQPMHVSLQRAWAPRRPAVA